MNKVSAKMCQCRRAAQLLRLTKADSLSPDNELWAGREGGANALWAECNATLEDQTLSVFGHASVRFPQRAGLRKTPGGDRF